MHRSAAETQPPEGVSIATLAQLMREAARSAESADPGLAIVSHLIAIAKAEQGALMIGNTLVPTHSLNSMGMPVPALAMDHDLVIEASLERRAVCGLLEGGRHDGVVPLTLGRERAGLVYLRLSRPPEPAEVDALETYALFAAQLLVQHNTRSLLKRSESSYSEKLEMALGLYDLYADAVGMAITDRMTGLGSRAYFEQRLVEQIDHARRHAQPLAVLLLDLDHFKAVNDTHGHLVGDQVLSGVGFVIRGRLRLSDVAGRFGGEEFAVLLPETDLHGACVLAERLRVAIAAWSLELSDQTLSITASVGVASLGERMAGPNDLVDAADRALYEAKHRGRDRVCVYQEENKD